MKRILTITFMVISAMIYSQNPTITIANLQVNNVNLAAGAPIDIGTNSSVNLKFRVDLAKGSTYDVGPATVYISIYKSNGSFREYETAFVPTSQFSTSASKSFNFDLLAEDVDFGNGNYLVAILKQDNPPGVQWESTHRSIIKTPNFTLTSSTNTIPCGSTNPVTFTVNGPSGTLSYNWNVGSGWSPSGSFSTLLNSIQLTPSAYPPTQVTVVTVFNGVSLPQLTKNINLASFNPQYTIAGNSSLCTSASYSIDNLLVGITVSGWSTSDTSIGTVSSNGNQATLTATGYGIINLQATVTNSCGQPATIFKNNIIVGKPAIVNHTINGGFGNMSVNSTSNLSVNAVAGATQYYWTITPSTTCSAGSGPRFSANNSTTFTTTSTSALIKWNDCIGDYAVVCYAMNSCGQTYIATKWVNVFDSSNNPCRTIPPKIKVVPNPIKQGSFTLYKEAPVDPCERSSVKTDKALKIENDVKIYDLYGKLVYNRFFNSEVMTISDLKLNSGNYILNVISSNGEVLRKLIIVE